MVQFDFCEALHLASLVYAQGLEKFSSKEITHISGA